MFDNVYGPSSSPSGSLSRTNSMDSMNSGYSTSDPAPTVSCRSCGQNAATWDGQRGTLTYADGYFVWSQQTTIIDNIGNGTGVMEERKPIWVPGWLTQLEPEEINERRSVYMSFYDRMSGPERAKLDSEAYCLPQELDQNDFEPQGRSLQSGLLRSHTQAHLSQLGI